MIFQLPLLFFKKRCANMKETYIVFLSLPLSKKERFKC